MNVRMTATAGGLASIVALAGCGGGAKPADSPGGCPEGTVLNGADCVPPGSAGAALSSDDPSPKAMKQAEDEDKPAKTPAPRSTENEAHASPTTGKVAYDRDSVEVELRRAGRQIKANCGSATDDEGNMTGPWGSTKATVILGRNGHIKQVTVPAPYDGKAVGACIVHSFQKIWFPPYAASTDVTVEWDVEVVQPKHK